MTVTVLWSSDSVLIPTGFGTQSLHFCRRLGRNNEINLKVMCWQYFGKNLEKFKDHQEPFDILPCSGQAYGWDMYNKYYELIKPDAMVTLADAWMVEPIRRLPRGHPWIGYFPVDGDPLSKNIHSIVKHMDERVAMSYFGKHVIEATGLDCTYIPHGFDPSIYKPLHKGDINLIKKEIGWEDKFIYGVVSRPNPRKHIERVFKAYGDMLKRSPEARKKTGLYLHMDLNDPMCPPNFMELLNIFGIENNVKITNHPYLSGVTPYELNRIYNLFDVQLLGTGGEGFGVTQIESGGAGVPTLVTNYTTPPEIQRGGELGMLIPTERIVMETSGVRKAWVDIDKFSLGMQYVFEHSDLLTKYKDNLERIMPYYHFENVVPKMEELVLNSIGNINMTEFKYKGE